MIYRSVARRYAKALFQLLGTPSIQPTRVGLSALARALTESPELKHVLASPAFRADDKVAVLSDLSQRLGCPSAVTGFLAQLVKKNRVKLLPDIADAFAMLADQAKGVSRVMVTSARVLDAEEQDRLRRRLRGVIGGEVELFFETEPGLLSGLQIRIGSTLFDSTIRSRFSAMRALLTME